MSRFWLSLGAILAGLSVGLGAMGAHLLDDYFEEKYASMEQKEIAGQHVKASYKYLQDFKTGAEYQMYHALGMIAVGLALQHRKSRALNLAASCFLIGIALFSGTLYAISLTGQRKLGAVPLGLIVPIGGVAFLLGWFSFAIGGMRNSATKSD